jgi:flavin-dependent dehydrogenase
MKVDYVILGAGLSGLVLRRALDRRFTAVLIDPRPGSWKVGEANVPEMFASPALASLLRDVRRLPSFAAKNGSVFVGDDSVAVYPIVSNPEAAVHVARDELEQLLLDAWRVPVVREAVREIDVEGRLVRTERAEYVAREQIIDCSGGAMLVAKALSDVKSLWPIHASWRYCDVERVDEEAFWAHLRDTRRPWLFIDIPRVSVLQGEAMRPRWRPHEPTHLTKVRDGEWLWQIPLFGARRLSVGLVSRHGPVDRAALDATIEHHRSRAYVLRARPTDGAGVYDRFHSVSGFARRAGRAAGSHYILVGDAFMFVDPIYSVGTSIAVNKALEVAALLNRGGWTSARCAAFCARYESLLRRRTAAFEHWYSESTREGDEGAARLRCRFPAMTAFQAGITAQYAKVVAATLRLTGEVGAAFANGPAPHHGSQNESKLTIRPRS